MKKKGSLFVVMAIIAFAITMVSCAGDTGGGGAGGAPGVNHAPLFTLVSQPIFIAKNANFNRVMQHATDADAGAFGSLTCSVQNNTCSFAVAVTGAGAGAVDCTASFTAPGTAEVCSFDIVVRDGGGLSVTDTIDVEVATVWYVDDSATGAGTGLNWTDAFTTIQAGVNAAAAGEFVFVADGDYTPTNPGDFTLLPMKVGVKIFGGFAGTESSTNERQTPIGINTVLDGGDSVCHVVNGAGYARLDGFYITNGNAVAGPNCPTEVGGGIYNYSVYGGEFRNLIIAYNYTAGDGGGMFNVYSDISLGNSVLKGNFALDRSGGIANIVSNASVDDSIILYNYSPGTGGGIGNSSSSNLQITNSQIMLNGALYAGGGIENSHSYLTINNSSIGPGNAAYYSGGGILNWNYSYLVMEDSSVNGNFVIDGGGGGITTAYTSYNYIKDSVFAENEVDYGGGAMYNYGFVYSTVLNSTFENNFGGNGGGIFNVGHVYAYVDSSIFKANHADFAGGAIANRGWVDTEITNSVFAGNTTYYYGGAVTTWDTSQTLILNDTFTGNGAYVGGGAVANGPNGLTTISNSILWDDMVAYFPYTSEIFDYTYGASYVVYSDIMGGWGGYGYSNINADPLFVHAPAQWDACINNGTTTTLEVGDGSIYQVGDVIEIELDGVARTVTAVAGNTVTFTPAFPVNTQGGMVVAIWGAGATNLVLDLSLQPTSPAIDAGWNNGGTAPVVDILGNPRPSGATWDMGAYEYQQ